MLEARSRLLSELESKFGMGGEAFVEQPLIQYQRVLDYLRHGAIEIGVALDGELLIGDNPAATYDHERRAVGLKAGVPLTAADTILLPLTPHHVLAGGRENEFVEMPSGAVDQTNLIQVLTAVEKVYARPGNTLGQWALDRRASLLTDGGTSPTGAQNEAHHGMREDGRQASERGTSRAGHPPSPIEISSRNS